MKHPFLLFLFVYSISQPTSVFAQPTAKNDHEEEIMRIKGKWTKNNNSIGLNDPDFPNKQYPFAFKKTDSIATLIKQIYPNPLGLEAYYYSSVGAWPLFKGAPASYMLTSFYKSYYFNSHLKKILLIDETHTAVRVYFNQFGPFLREQGEWMIDGQKTKVFIPLETDGEWKGLHLYKDESWLPGNQKKSKTSIVLINRNNKLPYIALTQKEYLLALKHFCVEEKQKIYGGIMNGEKEMLKIIGETKNNKYMDAATKEKMVAIGQKQYDDYMKNREADIQKWNEGFDKKIIIIDQYLSSHSDQQMQQPVATTSFGDFPGYFGADGKKRIDYPVRIDPSYFNTNLPKYVPQFIVIDWNAENDAPGQNFRKQFEENFPLKKLQAMIDYNGKVEIQKEVIAKTDPANDPELKAIRKNAEKYADSMLHIAKQIPGIYKPIPGFMNSPQPDTSYHYSFPSRNEKWLGAIPKKKLSSAELKTYLDIIDKKYTALLLAAGVKLPDISSMNVGDISYGSTLLLFKGMNEQAAWLAIKAALKSPGNILVLNNSGAVLNACGFQPVAVPVLETALEKSPGNSTVQNNVGQAYLALGDIQKATQYLQQSVSNNPYHPHANLSLAYIYQSKGDKSNALKYVENSIRSSFTDGAWHLLHKLKPDARLINYVKHRYKPPDYFNEDKYHLPRQCEKVSEIGLLKGEYEAFREMAEKKYQEFKKIEDEEYELGGQSLAERVRNYKNSNINRSPFTELGNAMLLDLHLRMVDDMDKIARAQHIYQKEIVELDKAYKLAYSNTDDCGEQINLSNRYMELMALVTREYQKTWLPFWKDFFSDFTFWSSVAHPDKHLQRADFAGAVKGYLAEVLRLAETHFLETTTDCSQSDAIKKQQEELKIYKPDCPIDIGLEFGIGSISIDCEKMEYHFGGLLVADVVHSYGDHRTTIAIGAGLDLKFGGEKLKAGPIQGGFGATGKMQYFLSFDGTHPADQGLIWEGAIKYKQKLITGNEEIGDIETNSVNLSAKTVLSVHNGFTSTGSLYEHLDNILEAKPEKQENKNIKIYKANN